MLVPGSTDKDLFDEGRLHLLAWISLQVFAFTAWFSITSANISLMVLVACWLACLFKGLGTSPGGRLYWLSFLWLFYLVLNAINASFLFPQATHLQLEGAFRFSQLLLFLPLGFFMGKGPRRPKRLLYLALLGIAVGLVLNQDWSQWERMLRGLRSGSNKWWYSTMGLYSATALFIMYYLAPSFLREVLERKKFHLFVPWICGLLIFSQALVVSQNRATWVGVLITVSVLVTFDLLFVRRRKKDPGSGRWPRVVCVAFFVMGALVLFANHDSIRTRLTSKDTPFLSGRDITEIDSRTPFGSRIVMMTFGLEKWKERPLLGWGAGTNLNKELGDPVKDPVVYSYNHLHNTYVEFLARLGVVGTFVFILLNVGIVVPFINAWRNGLVEDEMFYIVTSAIVLSVIGGMTDFRAMHRDFRFYYIFFAGIALGLSGPRLPCNRRCR